LKVPASFFYALLIWEVGMGAMMYQGCVAFRQWSERLKLDLLVSVGKTATAIVARFARVGGKKNR
jgi:hypothetical protein